MRSIESFLIANIHLVVLGSISASFIAHAFLSTTTFARTLASGRPWFLGVIFTWFSGVALLRIGWVPALSGLVGVAVAQRSNWIGRFSWIGITILTMTCVLWTHLHLWTSVLPRNHILCPFIRFTYINSIITVQLVIILLDQQILETTQNIFTLILNIVFLLLFLSFMHVLILVFYLNCLRIHMVGLLLLSKTLVLVLVHGNRLLWDALLALLKIRELWNAMAVTAIKDAERTLGDGVAVVATTTLSDVLRWTIGALVWSIFLSAQYFGLLLWNYWSTIVQLPLFGLLHMAQ